MRHYIAQNLVDGRHRINVALIGAGGTGSHVLTNLAKIHHSLLALDRPGLHVTVYDDDIVTEANVGRQMFGMGDVGQPKGATLVSRVNGYFGLDWDAHHDTFPPKANTEADRRFFHSRTNLVISCVDTGKARIKIGEYLESFHFGGKPEYWMDFGNSATTGQVVLGTLKNVVQPETTRESGFSATSFVPTIKNLFPDLDAMDETDATPSCSLRESLRAQDLFINAVLADLGANLLWQFIKNLYIEVHGFFGDIGNFVASPLKIDTESWGRFGFVEPEK